MTQDAHRDRILILDFGSQYAQLIARRVRELGVFCELWPCDADEADIRAFNPRGIILSGGPETVTVDHSLRAPDCIFNLGIPLLGICYGMQTMALQLGGKVMSSDTPEFGYAQLRVDNPKGLLADISDHVDAEGMSILDVWMSHGDHVTELPPGFVSICSTDNAPYSGMANFQRDFYALQCHPEVTHTRQGQRIFENFVFTICGCEASWTSANIIEDALETIRNTVGTEKVLVGLSGGVDSAVVAALLHQAIGDQLVCVLVDTGLLRAREADMVETVFRQHLKANLIIADARNEFLSALQGVDDPETKRKICGEQFIRAFEREASKLSGIRFLAQGTIYPDVIESAKTKAGKGHVIKSHHNVGGLPENLSFKLIEPLRELFKDEVRRLGLALGLPHELVYRHPFPGPGLAVRILGEITEHAIAVVQEADRIFIEELHKHDLYQQVSQAFAVFLPIKSVGVKGDARHYGDVIALRAVTSVDFMTAEWAALPADFLALVSLRIVNEIPAVSRVVYDITGKPPATIEWE